jgi:uncharacterized protein YgiM (DUF1202 family)
MKVFQVLVCAVTFTWGHMGLAQEAVVKRVQFPAGQSGTSINQSLTGYQSVEYLLGARAGQRMVVALTPSNPSTYFNIFAPGDRPAESAAMYVAATNGLRYDGVLPSDGDYRIQVFINRNAARRNESTKYTLNVSIGGNAPQQDYADGLSGGPDFWEVVGVSQSLNVRAAPSTSAPVRIGLLKGTVVRNLGCRRNAGRVWCQVSQLGGGVTGWAASQYLREATAPTATVSPAEQACLRAVTVETNNPDVVLLSSAFSEAGTEVMVGVGSQRAPWQCIAYSDGSTTRPMSMQN